MSTGSTIINSFLLIILNIGVLIEPILMVPIVNRDHLPATLIDQKQSGEYNLQLHLKDFQIIAFLADSSLGNIGDYDYNYDYADFTVKPTKFNGTTATSTIINTGTTPSHINNTSTTNVVDIIKDGPSNINQANSTSTIVSNSTLSTVQQSDKIKVQIIKDKPTTAAANLSSTINDEDGASIINIVDIVPSVSTSEIISSGLDHSTDSALIVNDVNGKRCGQGYGRDKTGRCKRLRKPAAFNLGRLATNLAARFSPRGS